MSNLDAAIRNGNLGAAGSNLAAILKAYPQYAAGAGDSASGQNSVNQDLQSLTDAIGKGDVDGTKSAWSKVQIDLTNNGLPAPKKPTGATAPVVPQSRESEDLPVVSSLFGAGPVRKNTPVQLGPALISSFLGAGPARTQNVVLGLGAGSDSSTGHPESVDARVTNWIAYHANGTSSNAAPASLTGSQLDTAA